MPSLKDKAISGASWSLAGRILQEGSTFLIGIILARLLTPDEYGLVAMATIFIYFSFVFVDSGFGSALVQKKVCSQADYSTIFYVNLVMSVVLFLLIYFAAPSVATFFNDYRLVKIVRVLAILIILFAFSIVHVSIIRRDINFKLKAQIEFISQICSGGFAIILALKGYGVWALIWKVILNQVFKNLQLWIRNHWFPSWVFSRKSLKDMFGFSSKLLISGILDRIYEQIYRLVIGKYFPARDLGLYTRADQFQKLPSQTISGSIMSFALPVFSKMQDEPIRLKSAVKRTIGLVMYFNLFALLLIGAIAKPMIEFMLGSQWTGAVIYLQILIGVGLLYPMQLINVQILTALGRSDLFLRVSILKKIVTIPVILLGIFVSIKAMLIGMVIAGLIALYINTYYTKKLINFGIIEQLKVFTKPAIASFISGIIVYVIGVLLGSHVSLLSLLSIQIVTAVILIVLLSKIMCIEEYSELKEILSDQYKKVISRRKAKQNR